jgi:hypothetical protein
MIPHFCKHCLCRIDRPGVCSSTACLSSRRFDAFSSALKMFSAASVGGDAYIKPADGDLPTVHGFHYVPENIALPSKREREWKVGDRAQIKRTAMWDNRTHRRAGKVCRLIFRQAVTSNSTSAPESCWEVSVKDYEHMAATTIWWARESDLEPVPIEAPKWKRGDRARIKETATSNGHRHHAAGLECTLASDGQRGEYWMTRSLDGEWLGWVQRTDLEPVSPLPSPAHLAPPDPCD